MPKLTDTYARAYDCCDQIFIELGRFPTIDLIRERIGVNSPTTIKKAMNEWTQHFAEKHFDMINRPDIPVMLSDAMKQAWKLAVIEAEKAYLQKEQSYQQLISQKQTIIEGLQQEKIFLNRGLEESRAQSAAEEKQIRILQQQVASQNQEQHRLLEQLKATEKQLTEQQAMVLEQTQRWQYQQEQDQNWFARRILEEKQFVEGKYLEKIQRLQQKTAVLTESETALQQLCASLRRDHQRLSEALLETQKSDEPSIKDKLRAHRVKHKGK